MVNADVILRKTAKLKFKNRLGDFDLFRESVLEYLKIKS